MICGRVKCLERAGSLSPLIRARVVEAIHRCLLLEYSGAAQLEHSGAAQLEYSGATQLEYSGLQLEYSGGQLGYSGVPLEYSGLQLEYNADFSWDRSVLSWNTTDFSWNPAAFSCNTAAPGPFGIEPPIRLLSPSISRARNSLAARRSPEMHVEGPRPPLLHTNQAVNTVHCRRRLIQYSSPVLPHSWKFSSF